MKWPLAAGLVCLAIASCSSAPQSSPSTSPASSTSAVTTTVVTSTAAPATPATTPATTEVSPPVAVTWQQVQAPSTCMCADGSSFSYWVRAADPTKVVFFLQGGGACFDPTTCAFDSGDYKVTVGSGDDPATFAHGIFDFTDPNNPLSDYSFVYVPYCTGDLHLGTSAHSYAPDLTVHHNGSVNASTALHDMATRFPNATDVVVAGESAGSAPTPLYAGLAHDLLPNAAVTVVADGSGAYPDVPAINALIGGLWGTAAAVPPWPEIGNITPEQWSLPGMFVQSHKHDGNIVFGRHDYAFDAVQQFFGSLAGFKADNLVELIDTNERQIEAAGVDLHSYIAPGRSHTVLSKPEFYTETVEGVPLVEWVSDLVRRQPHPDVHCTDCAGG